MSMLLSWLDTNGSSSVLYPEVDSFVSQGGRGVYAPSSAVGGIRPVLEHGWILRRPPPTRFSAAEGGGKASWGDVRWCV